MENPESNVRVNRKKKEEAPPVAEPEPEAVEQEEETDMPAEIPAETVKKAPAKAPAKKPVAKKEKEVYDVESAPDVVIHKRHKGAKPRKVIIITGDSSANESDEDLPYRAKPKVEIKKRPTPAAAPAALPKPSPARRQPSQNVGFVGKEAAKPADTGKGVSQRYAIAAPEKKGYVVDEYIDGLLGL